MDYGEFQKSISSPEPLYQLDGRDAFLRDSVFELARSQVDENARCFDWNVYDLERDSETELVGEARTLPWMGSRRWIYVRNAQQAGTELKDYLSKPAPRSVLVLEWLRKPSKWPKVPLIKSASDQHPGQWVRGYLKSLGFEIDQDAVRTLLESCGEERHRLKMELDKLTLLCAETGRIGRDAVLSLTRQSREYDVFALIGWLASARPIEALGVLHRLFEQGMTAPQILSMLYWNFRRLLVAKEELERGKSFYPLVKELKIWSYRKREAELVRVPRQRLVGLLLRLREADRLCKTTGLDENLILDQLVIDACREGSV